ncbi:MAG TPA: hypothetical protein VFD36_09995 [Kofleriaceae bacterium]|nr:hypothetical protein [Kofleriaceae bacterium]
MLIGSHISRYVVLEALGEGGTGSVYLVEHIDLKTRHAIKVLLPHLSRHHLPAAGSITLPVPADAGVALPRSAARATAETSALASYVVPFAQVWVDDSTVLRRTDSAASRAARRHSPDPSREQTPGQREDRASDHHKEAVIDETR